MASIIDSIKNVSGDSHPYFKITVLSVLLFITLQFNQQKMLEPTVLLCFNFAMVFFFLGYFAQTIYNTLNEKPVILPDFLNPIKTIWIGFLGSLAVLPTAFLVYWAMTSLYKMLAFNLYVNIIIMLIVFFALFTFTAIQLLFFARNYKLTQAYNLPLFLTTAGDIIAYSSLLSVFVILFSTVILWPIGYAVFMMFGKGFVLDYYMVSATLYVILVVLQYYAQLYFEFVDLGS